MKTIDHKQVSETGNHLQLEKYDRKFKSKTITEVKCSQIAHYLKKPHNVTYLVNFQEETFDVLRFYEQRKVDHRNLSHFP